LFIAIVFPPTGQHPDRTKTRSPASPILFDVSVAFIVALLIALFALFSSGKLLDKNANVTLVKQTENGEMEIITKQGAQIKVQKVTDKTLSGQGTRLGTAYRLANGQVVYVPDDETKPK
jgi:hypothetical protein